jgi:hypothetical protein
MSADSAFTDLTITLRDEANVVSTFNARITYSLSRAGAAGGPGSTGPTGSQARIAYAVGTSNFAFSGTNDVTKTGDVLPASGDWNFTTTWSTTPGVPTTGNSLYQVTGLFTPTTNQTVWNGYPYLSNLKVGQLDAISATIGILRTATSGARTEIKDNLIEVYDASNQLRVRLGIWT